MGTKWLTQSQIDEIKQRIERGETAISIAIRLGVNADTVRKYNPYRRKKSDSSAPKKPRPRTMKEIREASTLNDTVAKANAAGMTYGKYVASQRMKGDAR